MKYAYVITDGEGTLIEHGEVEQHCPWDEEGNGSNLDVFDIVTAVLADGHCIEARPIKESADPEVAE